MNAVFDDWIARELPRATGYEIDLCRTVWFAALASEPHDDPGRFDAAMKFYDVTTIPALIDAQAEHIKRLQEKLPPLRDTEPRNYRNG